MKSSHCYFQDSFSSFLKPLKVADSCTYNSLLLLNKRLFETSVLLPHSVFSILKYDCTKSIKWKLQ